MRNRPNHRRTHRTLAGLAVALLALTAGIAAPAPARAGGLPDPLELHRAVHDSVRQLLHDLVRVPVEIHRVHERELRAFFSGTVFEPRHRHSHVVYRFPVWVDGVVVYRPFTYCGGRLYNPGPSRPLLWNDWGTGRSARWCDRCHAYYPQRHAHFDVRYRSSAPRFHDSRRDWRDRYGDRYEHRGDDRHGWRDRDRHDHDRDRGRGRGHDHDRGHRDHH